MKPSEQLQRRLKSLLAEYNSHYILITATPTSNKHIVDMGTISNMGKPLAKIVLKNSLQNLANRENVSD